MKGAKNIQEAVESLECGTADSVLSHAGCCPLTFSNILQYRECCSDRTKYRFRVVGVNISFGVPWTQKSGF